MAQRDVITPEHAIIGVSFPFWCLWIKRCIMTLVMEMQRSPWNGNLAKGGRKKNHFCDLLYLYSGIIYHLQTNLIRFFIFSLCFKKCSRSCEMVVGLDCFTSLLQWGHRGFLKVISYTILSDSLVQRKYPWANRLLWIQRRSRLWAASLSHAVWRLRASVSCSVK